jgi:hypothetical protein
MEPNSLGGGMLLNIGFWGGPATPKNQTPNFFLYPLAFLGWSDHPSPVMGGGSSHPTSFLFFKKYF